MAIYLKESIFILFIYSVMIIWLTVDVVQITFETIKACKCPSYGQTLQYFSSEACSMLCSASNFFLRTDIIGAASPVLFFSLCPNCPSERNLVNESAS